MERHEVVIIGAGQAGLALSRELTRSSVEHVVLERGRIGQSWRDRWDSFCLVTPNWSIRLPDGWYDGPDPDGYLPRDEIWAFLERYAASFAAPVREGVAVSAIRQADGGFAVETSSGPMQARRVALASGAYQSPHRPTGASGLPHKIVQLDTAAYHNSEALPQGAVLVVGSGQSGLQIAEELHDAGRRVVVACGRAPWVPRCIGDRDMVWWGIEIGFLDQTVDSLPEPGARLWSNLQNSGHDGGHDLNLRTLQAKGVTLVGRFLGADEHWIHFAPDLLESAAWGDDKYRQFADAVRRTAAERGLPEPELPDPPAFAADQVERLPTKDFAVVIFAGGYRPAYTSWLPWPHAFDDMGFPLHRDGESTQVPGLHFIGVHFLRKRKSSLLVGVGEDAAVVGARIASGLGS
jgi:putative flavoprotein involved in K+ transport